MKSMLKHIVLAGMFCIGMATRSAANDVQVKIPHPAFSGDH